jgi:hypothetical protein
MATPALRISRCTTSVLNFLYWDRLIDSISPSSRASRSHFVTCLAFLPKCVLVKLIKPLLQRSVQSLHDVELKSALRTRLARCTHAAHRIGVPCPPSPSTLLKWSIKSLLDSEMKRERKAGGSRRWRLTGSSSAALTWIVNTGYTLYSFESCTNEPENQIYLIQNPR